MDDATQGKLEQIHRRITESGSNIIAAMQEIQAVFGYVSEENVSWYAARSGVPESLIFGVITFYTQFYRSPRGRNVITACCGTVCHVKGAQRVIARLRDELKLKPDEDTTRDGEFTVEQVACLGACSIAPVAVINKRVHGGMNPDRMAKEVKKIRDKGKKTVTDDR